MPLCVSRPRLFDWLTCAILLYSVVSAVYTFNFLAVKRARETNMQTETEDNESSNRCQGVSDICRFAESALQEAEKLRFSHNLSIVVTLFVGVNLNGTKLTRLLDKNNYVEREILAFRSFCTSMYTIDKDFHTEFVLVDAPDRRDRELLYNVLEPHIEQIPKTCH